MRHTPPFAAFRTIRWLLAAIVAVAAAATFSSSSNAAVFGSDNRRPLDSTTATLSQKIGTLASGRTGLLCTAFCVAPDMIATASHCLFGTAVSSGPRLGDVRFKLGAKAGDSTTLAGSQSLARDQTILSGTQQLAVAPPIGAAQDWAVAKLDRPLCTAGGLNLTTRSQNEIDAAAGRGEIYQVAVHSDLPGDELRVSRPCVVRKDFPNVRRAALARDFMALDAIVFHDCDTGGGSSGSPLLINTNTGPEVVAMNVGTYVLERTVPSARLPDEAPAPSTGEPLANTAIALTDLRDAIETLSNSDAMTNASDIQRIKSMLHDAGFYRGYLNSDVTDEVREAILRFNSVYGRPASSLMTKDLANDLERWLNTRAHDRVTR